MTAISKLLAQESNDIECVFTILNLSYTCFQVIQGQVADLIPNAVDVHCDDHVSTNANTTSRGFRRSAGKEWCSGPWVDTTRIHT